MTPFKKVPGSPLTTMLKRDMLLAKPEEFFKPFFNGRVPTLSEKLHFIEVSLQRITSLNVWENDTYTVEINSHPPFIHLDISRHDCAPCTNWHHFQQIKNELVGPEHEAVELFPAESRLVDTANQYHLWVYADPNFRFSFGFAQRFVLSEGDRVPLNSWQPLPQKAATVDGMSMMNVRPEAQAPAIPLCLS